MPRAKKGAAPRKQPSKPRRQSGQNPTKNRNKPQRGFFTSLDRDLSSMSSIASRYTKPASDFFAWVTGHGDYKVSGNSLLASSAPPSFSKDGSGIRVRHREYIADVISPGAAFTNTAYSINPGLASVFPWLASIAAQFEQYSFEGLLFEFRTLSAVAVSSTNTALGAVVAATNYDPYDAKFSNKQQMEAYEFSCSGPPCTSLLHPVECASRLTVDPVKFVRTNAVAPPGGDIRLYDMGLFQIATVGQQAASNVGELWVTYDVRLMKPKMSAVVGGTIPAYWATHTPVTTVSDFATPVVSGDSTLPVTYPTPQSIRIGQNGRYLICWSVSSSTSYTPVGLFTAGTGAAVVAGTTLANPLASGIGAGTFNMTVVVDLIGDATGAGGVVSKIAPNITGVATGQLIITQIPSNLP